MILQESGENYLETILMIGKRKSHVRSIDIANELEFSKPSVSVAMKNLRINGYIEVDAAAAKRQCPFYRHCNAYEFYQSQRQQGYEYFKTRKLHSDGSGRQHHSD